MDEGFAIPQKEYGQIYGKLFNPFWNWGKCRDKFSLPLPEKNTGKNIEIIIIDDEEDKKAPVRVRHHIPPSTMNLFRTSAEKGRALEIDKHQFDTKAENLARIQFLHFKQGC